MLSTLNSSYIIESSDKTKTRDYAFQPFQTPMHIVTLMNLVTRFITSTITGKEPDLSLMKSLTFIMKNLLNPNKLL